MSECHIEAVIAARSLGEQQIFLDGTQYSDGNGGSLQFAIFFAFSRSPQPDGPNPYQAGAVTSHLSLLARILPANLSRLSGPGDSGTRACSHSPFSLRWRQKPQARSEKQRLAWVFDVSFTSITKDGRRFVGETTQIGPYWLKAQIEHSARTPVLLSRHGVMLLRDAAVDVGAAASELICTTGTVWMAGKIKVDSAVEKFEVDG